MLVTNCYPGKNWLLSPNGPVNRVCPYILMGLAYGRALLFMDDPTPRLRRWPTLSMSPSTKDWVVLPVAFWPVHRTLSMRRVPGKLAWGETFSPFFPMFWLRSKDYTIIYLRWKAMLHVREKLPLPLQRFPES